MVTKVTAPDIVDKSTSGEGAAVLINDVKRAVNQLEDAKEPVLGVPPVNDWVLASSTGKVRKWVDMSGQAISYKLDNALGGTSWREVPEAGEGGVSAPLSAYWPIGFQLSTIAEERIVGPQVNYLANNDSTFLGNQLSPSEDYRFQIRPIDSPLGLNGKLTLRLSDNNTGGSPLRVVYDADNSKITCTDATGTLLGVEVSLLPNEVADILLVVYSDGTFSAEIKTATEHEYYDSTEVIPNVTTLVFSDFYEATGVAGLAVEFAWFQSNFFTFVTSSINTFAEAYGKTPDKHYTGADGDKIFKYTPNDIKSIAAPVELSDTDIANATPTKGTVSGEDLLEATIGKTKVVFDGDLAVFPLTLDGSDRITIPCFEIYNYLPAVGSIEMRIKLFIRYTINGNEQEYEVKEYIGGNPSDLYVVDQTGSVSVTQGGLTLAVYKMRVPRLNSTDYNEHLSVNIEKKLMTNKINNTVMEAVTPTFVQGTVNTPLFSLATTPSDVKLVMKDVGTSGTGWFRGTAYIKEIR